MALDTFSIAGDAVGAGIGLYEYLSSKKQLNELESQPLPLEQVSPELQNAYSLAASMSGEGFTPEEKAAFQAETNRASNTNYSKAVSLSGGNLANEIRGVINSDDILSYDKFAAKDAELHRQNIANLETEADKIQNQKNAIQDERLQYRYKMEEALGQANKAGLENIAKSLSLGLNVLGHKAPDSTNALSFGNPNAWTGASGDSVNPKYPGNIPTAQGTYTPNDASNYYYGLTA